MRGVQAERQGLRVEHKAQLATPGALRVALVVVALVLGGAAQLLVANGSLRWAATPYLIAVVAMALSASNRSRLLFGDGKPHAARNSTPGAVEPGITASPSVRLRIYSPGEIRTRWKTFTREQRMGIVALALSLMMLGSSLFLFPKGPPNALAWYLYGLSVIVLLLALPTAERRWTALANRLQVRPNVSVDLRSALPWAILGAILALALVIRLYNLQELPAGLWYDEADNLSHAIRIQGDPGSTLVFARSTNLPSLFLMPIALVINLTGVSITAGRLVSVGFSIVGIVVVFLLVRLMLGAYLGLVAAFLTSVMRWELNWSRIGMHGVTAPVFAVLTTYLTYRALRSGRVSDYGFAGAALGLGMWFYAPFRLFPIVLAFIFLHHLIFQRPEARRFLGRIAIMAFVSLVVAGPVVQSAIIDSDDFFARTNTTSVFKVFSFGDALEQIKNNLGEHLLMFNYKGDPNARHNLPYAPMLDGLSGMLMVLGLGIAIARWRNVALGVLPLWLFVMLVPGVITLPSESPQSLRSIVVIPAVIMTMTLAVGAIWWAGRSAPWHGVRRVTPVFLAALLGGIAILNINTYFGAQADNPDVFTAFSTDETLMSRHILQQQRLGYSLLVSRQFLFGKTLSILANNPRLEVITAPVNIPLDPAAVWRGAAIYLEPREEGFYRLLQTYYPDGEFQEVRPPAGGNALYYSAVITREQLEARKGLVSTITLADGTTFEAMQPTTAGINLPVSALGQTQFDVEWTGTLHIRLPGEYEFVLDDNIGAEVILDGKRILGDGQKSVRIEPALGLHTIEVRGRATERASVLRLLWEQPRGEREPIPLANLYHGTVRPVGLTGLFYEGDVQARPIADASRITPALDNFWYDAALPEPYTAVWEGTLDVPDSGDYRFELRGAGTMKLILDRALQAQQPEDLGIGPNATVPLERGKHRIRVEYFSPSPPSEFEIRWGPPGHALEPIPIENLSPAQDKMFRIVSDRG